MSEKCLLKALGEVDNQYIEENGRLLQLVLYLSLLLASPFYKVCLEQGWKLLHWRTERPLLLPEETTLQHQ